MKKLLLTALLLSGLNAETFLDVEKRCYKGSMIDCYNLALMYESGEGIRQSFYSAARLFRMVCNAGEPKDVYLQACYNLGFIYFLGKEAGIRQDFRQAITLFSKACSNGEQKSCYQLGMMYANGDGTKQNYSTAKEYFRKACDLGHNDGCKDYVEINERVTR
ncbi:MAG: tetratricopeptide repeat protein [Sulfurovum sp.]|jgi:TPR repeat protein|uniref:tetratricopeptide repeat protein n=1 Tax=Sulfurovum sp. TaxID=1969726 RepID=UPI003C7597B1